MTVLQLSRAVLVFTYTVWFVLVAAGLASYEGEPVVVKSRDLPLHWFDLVFRRFGALLLFGLLAVRAAAAARTWRSTSGGPFTDGTVLKTFALFLGLAFLRMAIYQLHVAGYIFTPQRWARDNLGHPPHVMSDHVLLGASLMGGFACEAVLGLLSLRSVRADSEQGIFARLYSLAATVMSVLVSCECYYTARYFHPPREIILGAILGLLLFQIPPLMLCLHELRQHVATSRDKREPGGSLDHVAG